MLEIGGTMDYSPILISLKTASLSIVITFFIGIFAAKWVVELKSQKAKIIIDGLFTMPLVLPPTVLGFFILYILGVKRPLGRLLLEFFSVKIVFSWSATVIAAVAVSFPLMYRSARGAFEQVDKNFIQAARTLGMCERSIFWRIIMPLALPGVTSGGILSFTRGLGEFGATAMIAGNIANKTRTLPLAIYSEVAAGDMEGAYEYVVIVLIVSFIVLSLMNYFTIKESKYSNKDVIK